MSQIVYEYEGIDISHYSKYMEIFIYFIPFTNTTKERLILNFIQ